MGSNLSHRNEVAPCENPRPLVPSIAITPGTANSDTAGGAATGHTEESIATAEDRDGPSTSSQSVGVRKRKKTALSQQKENRPPMEEEKEPTAERAATILPYGYQPGTPFIRLGAGAPSLNFVWSNTFSGDGRRKTVAGTTFGGAANISRASANKADVEMRRHTTGEPPKHAPEKGSSRPTGKRLPTIEAAQNRSAHQKPVLRRQRSSVISIGSTREGLEVKLVEREWAVDNSTNETAF
uniref:Uncharacterized protein n=1 Tax=Branchiostoma floridae TaxID=7739 RepID=C3ZQJ4_BRAFL|eukprot:XP_002589239.1 hypothetical protein BRAFLDRAFT_74604 [Branchiostoma floridae]